MLQRKRKKDNELLGRFIPADSLQQFYKFINYRLVGIQAFWRHHNKQVKAKINMSTGILLTHQYLITSAHNIYVNQYKTIATDLRIILMEDNDDRITDRNYSLLIKPKLNQNVVILFREGNKEKGLDLDLALIRLKRLQVLPNQLNYWTADFDQLLQHKARVLVCGFPDYKVAQNLRLKSQSDNDVLTRLKIDLGVVQKFKFNYIYYQQVSTVVGQSGGPIFVYLNQQFYLVGIHTQYNQKSRTGKGIMLSKQMLKKEQEWEAILNPQIVQEDENKAAGVENSTDFNSTHDMSTCNSKQKYTQFQKHFWNYHFAHLRDQKYITIIESDTKD